MSINLQMPALSPTMEEGTLAKWLVKEGDTVSSGDLLAEIETDKATMEFEAIDDGVIAKILIPEGTDHVKVGEVIAIIASEGEKVGDVSAAPAPSAAPAAPAPLAAPAAPAPAMPMSAPTPAPMSAPAAPTAMAPATAVSDGRIKASPLARRLAGHKGIDLAALMGSGPGGRVIKADVDAAQGGTAAHSAPAHAAPAQAAPAHHAPTHHAPAHHAPMASDFDIPHVTEKLSNVRKVIAKRLTEAKQTIPHIYLTVDVQLDNLLKLRSELNATLEPRGIKLSINDMLIKAQAIALMQAPKCNVSIDGEHIKYYKRADISVAVSIPDGLITPIITSADTKSLGTIATEIKELAGRAREGKLKLHEFQGGTASISNMGMFGISQFDAVINPPQAMILAIGAGEKRPHVINDSLQIATIMSVTGSFDHRAIDGADGAQFMKIFKQLCENPLSMLA